MFCLALARMARDKAREAIAAGEDPSQLKREAKLNRALDAANSFEVVARKWWDHWNGTKSPRHANYVIRRLEADVFPSIGTKPITRVTAPHLLATRLQMSSYPIQLNLEKKENYAYLDAKEIPELLLKIEDYQESPYTRLAIKFMALTFVRTGELIGARWLEFDLEAAEWRIPAERMKMRAP